MRRAENYSIELSGDDEMAENENKSTTSDPSPRSQSPDVEEYETSTSTHPNKIFCAENEIKCTTSDPSPRSQSPDVEEYEASTSTQPNKIFCAENVERHQQKVKARETKHKRNPVLDENKVRNYLLKEIAKETRALGSQALQVNEEIAQSLRLFRQMKRSVVSQYYASSRSNVMKHPVVAKVEEDKLAASVYEDVVPRKSTRKRTMQHPKLDEPRRNLSIFNLRFYVGTMCKYLGNADTGLSTHKWTVYIRNCDTNRENICHHIAKVTFILHDSYKPHNVVSVYKEPFKITREGWGEFSMKIHIRFNEREHNPNVELVHPVNFLHVKSAIPIISLESPIDLELTTSQIHTVIKENQAESNENQLDQGTCTEERNGSQLEERRIVKGEREGKKSEPDLKQTVLEYLTGEDMAVMDEILSQSLDHHIDIT